ncbi:MAG: hypothetical protein A3H96_17490 [Acidobacteria bacterium RIFCSPLOWO2_02_FULL_67_36]|nr:MAG: hypothetical protein A3H96_17490 [Acidobacteria bacterium RIFCSPLOWO2_02_FULL_67_36]OFW25807.1 MAG: hypothetical protein A3G21_25375 [Acidobacteria bacterium RIFCSPLOWO2_12_FULL_66_21]
MRQIHQPSEFCADVSGIRCTLDRLFRLLRGRFEFASQRVDHRKPEVYASLQPKVGVTLEK